jgi:RNA polymerase sigma factor (sigma-70 family)
VQAACRVLLEVRGTARGRSRCYKFRRAYPSTHTSPAGVRSHMNMTNAHASGWWRIASRSVEVYGRRAVAEHRVALQDVEDLQQALLLQSWQAMARFDESRSGIRTYIEMVIRSRYASCLRLRRPKPSPALRDQPDQGSDAVRRLHLRIDVGRVIAGLPARERQLAHLLMLYRPAEAFRRLGLSHASGYQVLDRLRSNYRTRG